MPETKWAIWTLPSSELQQELEAEKLILTLVLPSDNTQTVELVERAAKNAGMLITRLP